MALASPINPVRWSRSEGRNSSTLIYRRVHRALYQRTKHTLGQPLGGWVHRHETAGVDKLIAAVKQFVFGGLKDQIAPEDVHLPAQDYLDAVLELFRNPRHVEPSGPDIAGFVSQNGLGGLLPSQHSFPGFPHSKNCSLVVAGGKLGDRPHIGEVVVPAGEQVYEVADSIHFQFMKARQQFSPDAFQDGDVVGHLKRTARSGWFSGRCLAFRRGFFAPRRRGLRRDGCKATVRSHRDPGIPHSQDGPRGPVRPLLRGHPGVRSGISDVRREVIREALQEDVQSANDGAVVETALRARAGVCCIETWPVPRWSWRYLLYTLVSHQQREIQGGLVIGL